MAYRKSDLRPKFHLPRVPVFVKNGCRMRVVIPCVYSGNKSIQMIDHLGWPEPRRIDESWQHPFYGDPVNLQQDYQSVSSNYDQDNFNVLQKIDGNRVVMNIIPNIPEAVDDEVIVPVSIVLIRDDNYKRDLLVELEVHVLPGATFSYEDDDQLNPEF